MSATDKQYTDDISTNMSYLIKMSIPSAVGFPQYVGSGEGYFKREALVGALLRWTIPPYTTIGKRPV
jgi:hypothetical protein